MDLIRLLDNSLPSQTNNLRTRSFVNGPDRPDYDGGDRPDRVLEVGCLLLSCYSNDSISGNFLVTTVFLTGNYQFGFIGGVEESSSEVSVWLEMTWVGWIEGLKFVAILHFSATLLE